jgi:hypothetical protein
MARHRATDDDIDGYSGAGGNSYGYGYGCHSGAGGYGVYGGAAVIAEYGGWRGSAT